MAESGTFDTIMVEDLEFLGFHGVYDEERAEGRRFRVDVEVDVAPLARAGETDALEETLDYRAIAAVVQDVFQGPSVHLIERLADTICRRLLASEPMVQRVRLSIRKAATGVPGDPRWVGVRMERGRSV
jgi:dihydroneopterin aldolase